MMWERKVKTRNWCSQGNILKIFNYKCRERKNIKYSGETLIYNALFYIFKLIFINFFYFIKKPRKNL